MSEKILLAQDTITNKNIDELVDWLKTYPKLTKGEKTVEFEYRFAEKVGSTYAVFVNSGSSANLLMLYALKRLGRLKSKKIIVPALSWITDISPVMQLGLEPILCDASYLNLGVDTDNLEMLFHVHKPSALMLVSVLGMSPDMGKIQQLCEKYDVILLEDACESLGSTYYKRKLGTIGLMGSYSLYFGHIISTIEGGMIVTNDVYVYNMLKMLRSHGWERDLAVPFKKSLREVWHVNEFNAQYTFYEPGFNLRSTDLQAFIGLSQLKMLDHVVAMRETNFLCYNDLIKNEFWKPDLLAEDTVANLGYPVIHPKRDLIAKALIEDNVEVRPLISGNMGKQPFFVKEYGLNDSLPFATMVDQYGMYLPNHPYLSADDIKRISKTVNDVINLQ